MSGLNFSIKLRMPACVFCVCLAITLALGQNKTPTTEDVLKIKTDLIQTGVAVVDKDGAFVNNLKREDFELSVDGKPISISFFQGNEIATRRNDEATAERKSAEPGTPNNSPVGSMRAGRNILFYVDDYHLSFDSHQRVKKPY